MNECCHEHGNHEARINSSEKRLNKLEDLIDKVRNRLPNWATVGFALLTLIIGWLVKGIN